MEVNFNSYGFFDFSRISYEVTRLRKEIEDMEDDSLINEVMDGHFWNEELEDIAMKFAFEELPLTPDERELFIGFYILIHCEEDLDLER